MGIDIDGIYVKKLSICPKHQWSKVDCSMTDSIQAVHDPIKHAFTQGDDAATTLRWSPVSVSVHGMNELGL